MPTRSIFNFLETCFRRVLVFFLLLSFSGLLLAIPAEVENLSDRTYFPAVLKAIQGAQKSVHVCLYYIAYNSKEQSQVRQVLDALVAARKRGVDVQVLLDRSFKNIGTSDISQKNVQSFSFLRRNGVPVFYDELGTLTHVKYWVVDEKIVIVGSFNLSETALTKNREAAVRIESPELGLEYSKQFQAIPKFNPEPVKNAIPIPREFIQDKEGFARLTGSHSPELLAFQLLLWKESFLQKSEDVVLTEPQIFRRHYEGKEINFRGYSILGFFLDRFIHPNKAKYPFLNCDYDKDKRTLTFHLDKPNTLQPESLFLSELYWSDGWDQRLSENALFSLLYVLDKTDSGRMGRYFEEERWEAVKKYGVDHTVFAYGLQELQRWNLIEKYIHFQPGERNANGYQLNEFYRLADFESSLKTLREKTDPEVFRWAMDIADTVDEPHDLDALRKILELGKERGADTLKQVADTIRKKAPISPYRRLPYVLAVIRNHGKEIPLPETSAPAEK